jgi:hypothetical protein
MVWDIIIGVLNVLKCYFVVGDKPILNYVEMPFERIFYDLGFQKRDLDDVAEVKF